MKEPAQDRSLDKLNGIVKELLALAVEDLRKQGVTPLIVETFRTPERQMWLFGQGRTASQLIQKKVPVEYAHPGAVVTQTLNSIHKTGCAVDMIPVKNGKAVWNANDPDTKKIIATMTKYGFEAGANWKTFKDSPHYQIKLPQPKYNSVSKSNTTTFLTRAIQRKLKLADDGKWGQKTDEAIIAWRKERKLTPQAVLYAANLKDMFI